MDSSGSLPGSGGLAIESFTSTVDTVSDSDSVTFIAMVTDSEGLETIAGGTLVDETGATYGAFGGDRGTYQLAVGWGDFDQVRALEFGPGGETRTFTARFIDDHQGTAEASLDIRFSCGTYSACGSSGCKDLETDGMSCGTCGHACDDPLTSCDRGMCRSGALTACAARDNGTTTCDDYCPTLGHVCTNCDIGALAEGWIGAVVEYSGPNCSDSFTSDACYERISGESFRCCCTQ